MEFRRINALPPYVLGVIEGLKMEARRAGDDVVDLGFGNPDIPSPPVAVDKLCEAVQNLADFAPRECSDAGSVRGGAGDSSAVLAGDDRHRVCVCERPHTASLDDEGL